MRMYLVTRGRKPYAIRRARKSGGYTQDYKRARSYEQFAAEENAKPTPDTVYIEDCHAVARNLRKPRPHHAFILRPGRFFYCMYCGARMTATQSVMTKTARTTEEPREILCILCAHDRGYKVLTTNDYARSADTSAAWQSADYLQ